MSETPKVIKLTDYLKRHPGFRQGKCKHGSYVIDMENGDVYCDDCKAPVSHFHVLRDMCNRYQEIEHAVKYQRDLIEELKKTDLHLKAAKRIEKLWRGGNEPLCPHCKTGIAPDGFGRDWRWGDRKAKRRQRPLV